ncbi:hypothetical protein SPRG_19124 [Saprolegnia parasitica CBS 223.65]|uniref:Nudix hydrolase domain-containing protein n=1 Tax=Saprolegnia parasitica (strain CBS 223.65) TaxID=695850 RepID=A0A067CYH9_SAPPC|nr:hypothetical protein SPRG_19124 [Saprolegnia parasitica CBS 223.65]KDO34310.1 hypothetical protein SPRG_19124 [Saprolegnia parasitica CBS 223.65]|eukprot:XP_012195317.1 hypothetical protein SPRG_19124 [Saprolegnia parasitica CBS 223.65]
MRQLVDIVRRNNRFAPATYAPLLVGQRTVGLVAKERVSALKRFPDVFSEATPDRIQVHPHLAHEAARTRAMMRVARALQASGDIEETWKQEDYGARDASDQVVFRVDRSAAAFFGITQCGCHLNGYVRHGPRPDDVSVWMGLRHASRALWPHKWDSIVGGGLPLDISPWDNMLKEASEEAMFSADDIAHLMRSVGVVSYVHSEKEGLKHNTMFVFDACLPDSLVPRCDGDEVERFELWPIHKALALVEASPESFKPDICLLLIDFGLRHGILTPDNTAAYTSLVHSLRATPPF